MAKRPETFQCALCERSVRQVSQHHLIPRSEGGREVVPLCGGCHSTVHSFFTNRTLSSELYTIEALRRDPDVARYLGWVRRQRDSRIVVRRRRDRR